MKVKTFTDSTSWHYKSTIQVSHQTLNDQTLKEIALLAQRQAINSEERAYFLIELVKGIRIYAKYSHFHKERFSDSFYRLIYEEAIARTTSFICLNIDSYNPSKEEDKFMNWFNFLLDKEVLRCHHEFDSYHNYQFICIDNLSTYSSEQSKIRQVNLIYQCIQRDITDKYKQAYIIDNPQGTFQKIALAHLDGISWSDIGEEINSSAYNTYAFYRRHCIKFKQLLRKELENMQMQ